MKKLFTLVFGVLFTLCAQAVTSDIGVPTNHIKDDDANQVFYDPDTKVITFYKQWDYRPGWWLSPKDCSAFDEFVLELDNPDKVKIQIVLEYTDTYTEKDANDQDVTKFYSTSQQGDGNKIVLTLDAAHKQGIRQIYLQCVSSDVSASTPKTVTFKSAYFNSVEAGEATVLFEGETIMSGWQEEKIDKAKFANVVAGDKLHFVYGVCEPTAKGWNADWGSQIHIKSLRDGWNGIAGQIAFKAAGENLTIIADDEIEIPESSAENAPKVKTTMLKELQNYGLVVQGIGAVLKKIELIKSTTGISNTIAAPAAKDTKIYNLAGQQVNASYKGVVIKNGKKYMQ